MINAKNIKIYVEEINYNTTKEYYVVLELENSIGDKLEYDFHIDELLGGDWPDDLFNFDNFEEIHEKVWEAISS